MNYRNYYSLLFFCFSLTACLSVLSCSKKQFPIFPQKLDFHLYQDNNKVHSKEIFQNNLSLLYFGYTHCPDFCPNTLNKLKQVYLLDSPKNKTSVLPLQTILITTDPKRDTPQVLKKYLSAFAFPVQALYGSIGEIKAVAKQFSVYFDETFSKKNVHTKHTKHTKHHKQSHSTYLFLIDPKGRIRHIFRYQDSTAKIIETIKNFRKVL